MISLIIFILLYMQYMISRLSSPTFACMWASASFNFRLFSRALSLAFCVAMASCVRTYSCSLQESNVFKLVKLLLLLYFRLFSRALSLCLTRARASRILMYVFWGLSVLLISTVTKWIIVAILAVAIASCVLAFLTDPQINLFWLSLLVAVAS